jgi:preprotein translocase subunit SecF
MHLRLLPDNTNIDFVKYRWIAFGLTLLMAAITVAVLFTHGRHFDRGPVTRRD